MSRRDYVLRGIYPYTVEKTPKHVKVIERIFRPAPNEVKQIDLCCGRGFGKTYLAIYVACRALSLDNMQTGLFLEPDWSSIESIFLDNWRKIVPDELYVENRDKKRITWINGSILYYGARNITGSIDARRNKYRGRNLTFVIDDEAAIGCDVQQYQNTLAAIRNPSPVRFYFTISTPLLGQYRHLITSPRHTLFTGTSKDNYYRPTGYVENLIANMSADQVRREIYAEFISLEGRLWKDAIYEPYAVDTPEHIRRTKETAWPNGNRHDTFAQFDPKRPWYLFCDLGGATGAYVVVQSTEAVVNGRQVFRGPVWVAVADLCPINDASAARAFQRLKAEFGVPIGVVAGADIETRSTTDGLTVSYFVQKVWPNTRIYPCNESFYNKQIQYDALSYLFCDAHNNRRFAVARNFKALEPNSKRGVIEMINEDEWPDESKRRPSDMLPKNKEIRVQHVRDALLMGAVQIMIGPTWTATHLPKAS